MLGNARLSQFGAVAIASAVIAWNAAGSASVYGGSSASTSTVMSSQTTGSSSGTTSSLSSRTSTSSLVGPNSRAMRVTTESPSGGVGITVTANQAQGPGQTGDTRVTGKLTLRARPVGGARLALGDYRSAFPTGENGVFTINVDAAQPVRGELRVTDASAARVDGRLIDVRQRADLMSGGIEIVLAFPAASQAPTADHGDARSIARLIRALVQRLF